MLVVLSPAKRLNWDPPPPDLPHSEPRFADQADALAALARELDVAALQRLMHISAPLARLNRERFARFVREPAPDQTRPAAYGFDGDTYAGLEFGTLDADARDYATRHLRILSGLYGVLRPFDAIQPHRLEMGSRLANPQGRTLYDWWGGRIARALNADAARTGATVLVNCASAEYFRAVDAGVLALRIVTPVFMEDRPEGPRIVSIHAKKARGAMARFILEHRLDDPAALADFDIGGYAHDSGLSSPDRPVFLR